jgi:Spy/CpxP family protein refolding chaperone
MNRYMIALLGAAFVVGILGGIVLAGDEQSTTPAGASGPGMFLGGKLNLSDEQKAKVKEIMDAARTAAKDAADVQAKMQALKDAFEKIKTDDQRKQIEEAKGKLAAGLQGLRGRMLGKARSADGQQAKDGSGAAPAGGEKPAGHGAGVQGKFGAGHEGMGGPMLGKLSLTDEQKAKIKEIMQAAKDAIKNAADGPAKMQALKDAFEKIKTGVLTDEQRKLIEDAKGKLGQLRQKIRERLGERAKDTGGGDAKPV